MPAWWSCKSFWKLLSAEVGTGNTVWEWLSFCPHLSFLSWVRYSGSKWISTSIDINKWLMTLGASNCPTGYYRFCDTICKGPILHRVGMRWSVQTRDLLESDTWNDSSWVTKMRTLCSLWGVRHGLDHPHKIRSTQCQCHRRSHSWGSGLLWPHQAASLFCRTRYYSYCRVRWVVKNSFQKTTNGTTAKKTQSFSCWIAMCVCTLLSWDHCVPTWLIAGC